MAKFELTPKQIEARELLAGPAKHIQLEGGSRSGKTFLFLRAIATRALRAPASRHAVLRFRSVHVKHSVYMDTWKKMLSLCFPQVSIESNRTDLYDTLPNGSEIWFGGLDDSDRVLGNEYATIFLNETTQISWDARNLVMTRLAQRARIADEYGNLTDEYLPLRMFYDLNPGDNTHWSAWLFKQGRDPLTKQPLRNKDEYASMQINPGDNLVNLPADYIDTLMDLPARQRKRFLEGVYTDANADALFDSVTLDKWRTLHDVPDMQRVVISVDPSGADDQDNADNDAIGIVVAGMGTDGNGYLLADLTIKAGPATWGKVVAESFVNYAADMVVGETNFGGAMVGHTIQTARAPDAPKLPYTKVTASRGKVPRAEPISSLAERGKIRMAGYFTQLEDELCAFTTRGYTGALSPNSADAYIWAFSYLFPGLVKQHKEPPKPKAPRYVPAGGASAGWMGA